MKKRISKEMRYWRALNDIVNCRDWCIVTAQEIAKKALEKDREVKQIPTETFD